MWDIAYCVLVEVADTATGAWIIACLDFHWSCFVICLVCFSISFSSQAYPIASVKAWVANWITSPFDFPAQSGRLGVVSIMVSLPSEPLSASCSLYRIQSTKYIQEIRRLLIVQMMAAWHFRVQCSGSTHSRLFAKTVAEKWLLIECSRQMHSRRFRTITNSSKMPHESAICSSKMHFIQWRGHSPGSLSSRKRYSRSNIPQYSRGPPAS